MLKEDFTTTLINIIHDPNLDLTTARLYLTKCLEIVAYTEGKIDGVLFDPDRTVTYGIKLDGGE